MDKTFVTYGFTHQELLVLGRTAAYVNNTSNSNNDLQRLHRFIHLMQEGYGIKVTPAIAGAIFEKMKKGSTIVNKR